MKKITLKDPKINGKNLDKETREYIERLEAGFSYFRNYSHILEREIEKDKKKMKNEAITTSKNEGIQLKLLFSVSDVAKSSYHYSLKHNVIEEKDMIIVEALNKLSEEQLKRGTKHKRKFLEDMGIKIGYKRLWRICHRYGFLSDIRILKHPKNYYAQHKMEVKNTTVNNILNREFECDKLLTKLCTDITYVKIKDGWLFLSVIIDLCNREIVSYAVSNTIDTALAIETVRKLKAKYGDLNDCLLHSDQGCTYTSNTFDNFVRENNFIRSMSRRGNCHDNAIVENFFGTLKNESIYKKTLKNGKLTYKEMQKMIEEYIEYYNNRRIQERLGFKSPVDFRKEKELID